MFSYRRFPAEPRPFKHRCSNSILICDIFTFTESVSSKRPPCTRVCGSDFNLSGHQYRHLSTGHSVQSAERNPFASNGTTHVW